METTALAPIQDDEGMDRNDHANIAEQAFNKALETNHSLAMRQMDVLSKQNDAICAFIQKDKLTDQQFKAAMSEFDDIRREATETAKKARRMNYWLVVGTSVLFGGALFFVKYAA